MKIIDEAWRMHAEHGGIVATSAGDDPDMVHRTERDMTTHGDAPLTRMLRGRYWLHHNPEGVFEEHRPPQTYLDMVEHYPLLHNVIAYQPEPGQDRYYEAALTVREFRYFGRHTNDWLANNQQLLLQEKLAREFQGVGQIRIPVLYDEVNWIGDPDSDQYEPDFENQQSAAFLPNGVNMQIINNRVLIPKPFGPRAHPHVAAEIPEARDGRQVPRQSQPQIFCQKEAGQDLSLD